MPSKINVDIEKLREVAKNCDSYYCVGFKMGLSTTTAMRRMRKYGMELGKGRKSKDINVEDIFKGVKTFGNIRAYARSINVSQSFVVDRLRKHKIDYHTILQRYQNEIAPDLTSNILRVNSGDGIMIQADHHCPFLSLEWHYRALKYAKKHKIKKLVIGGDFFDFDRLSWWLKVANASDIAVELEEELSFSEMILNELNKQFNEIYFLGGNHWRNRLMSAMTYSIKTNRLFGLVGQKDNPNYHFSEHYDWLLIDDKLRVTHPRKARKLDGTLARDIAIKFPAQWVIVAHRHRVFSGFTPDGRPSTEIGWMGDTNRMCYYQHVDTSYYNWINGFCVWQDSTLKNLFEYNYDWKSLGDK